MKILHVNSLYHPHTVGGAERSVQALAELQLARGHEIAVATLSRSASHVAAVEGVRVHYVGLKNLYWPFGTRSAPALSRGLWHALDAFNPLMGSAMEDILRKEKPDVVHTHNLTGFSAAVWRAARKQSHPIVHTLRDYSFLCPKATMFYQGENCGAQHWTCRAYATPRRKMSPAVAAVTGISQFVLDRHLASSAFATVPIKKVIPNFLTGVVDASLKSPRDVFTFGFIGQLAPAKGLDRLLTAFRNLRGDSSKLLVAGEGEPAYERQLKAQAAGMNVEFLGRIQPGDFYPAIDALVVPSLWHEPFGRVILEAYAYGIPVLASKRGGIPEIVDDDETGLLFDPDQPEELERALQRLASDPSLVERLGSGARRKAKEFLPEAVGKQYDSVYSLVTG